MAAFVGQLGMSPTTRGCLVPNWPVPCPSFLQLWSKDILGTNLSHPISHILVLCFTF